MPIGLATWTSPTTARCGLHTSCKFRSCTSWGRGPGGIGRTFHASLHGTTRWRDSCSSRQGRWWGHSMSVEPVPVDDPIERRYLVRETRVRMHQAQFRGRVIPAYRDQCTICRLKEARLLDAAHIVGDLELLGEAVVSNGLSLCAIHHRAFDQDLVGISPDYEVRVSDHLLEDDDGPMLDVLKGFHGQSIYLPTRHAWRPGRERLAQRFERFKESGSNATHS
jgi:putative restriction endonuclease